MKKIFALFLVLASGLFLSGCTRNNVELEKNDQEVEDVVVIEDEEDDEDEIENEIVEESDEDPEEDKDEPSELEEEEEDDVADTSPDSQSGSKTVGTALSADGAMITAYSYGIANGKLEFSWKVRGSSSKPYPKATASVAPNKNIVVEFESLRADYVADEDGSLTLGNNLPKLSWVSTSNGSKYTFDFKTERKFEIVSQEIDDEGTFIILKVDL